VLIVNENNDMSAIEAVKVFALISVFIKRLR